MPLLFYQNESVVKKLLYRIKLERIYYKIDIYES